MKQFETPEIEVIEFAAEDIITMSSPTDGDNLGGDQLPFG